MGVVSAFPRRDEVWLASLDPAKGNEMRRTRPCLVISPDEMNRNLAAVIVAPMTAVDRHYPTRISSTFQGRRGQIALDQMRAMDKQRLLAKLGAVSAKTAEAVSLALIDLFTRA
jgi:mRNA interferase MazF